MSHGYLATGTLADKIALPSLIHIPSVALPTDITMDAFLDHVSAAERSLLRRALQSTSSFPSSLATKLSSNHTHKVWMKSSPKHIKFSIITTKRSSNHTHQVWMQDDSYSKPKNMAVDEFCIKPAATIVLMNAGVRKSFWATKSPQDIQRIHRALTATPSKVISMLSIPVVFNPAEERVVGYL